MHQRNLSFYVKAYMGESTKLVPLTSPGNLHENTVYFYKTSSTLILGLKFTFNKHKCCIIPVFGDLMLIVFGLSLHAAFIPQDSELVILRRLSTRQTPSHAGYPRGALINSPLSIYGTSTRGNLLKGSQPRKFECNYIGTTSDLKVMPEL